jgi:hypothetical protein
MTECLPSDVAAVYAGFPPEMRARLMEVRALLFDLAGGTGVGPLTETLKWGEPAYLTDASRAGTTVRLGVTDGQATVFAPAICLTRALTYHREKGTARA